MLSALLLAGLVAAPIATVALFLRPPFRGRSRGAWPWARRLTLALVATAALAAISAAILWAFGATTANVEAGATGLVVTSLLWLPVTRRWSARGHVAWAATTYLFIAYLVFMIWWTFASTLGVTGTIGGLILWVLELFAGFLGCAYLWELCDALGRESWVRRISQGVPTEALPAVDELPFVSLHVPAYNEPPDMVIATLTSLLALDYPHYEIVVLDDNTDDESLWRPVEQWCHEHQIKFAHLHDWPGYKSGALNYALRSMIDPRTELIGVIDSDYQIEPDFLRRCAPLFADSRVGFIQAPQDYRDWQQASFYRRLYYSYKYFFAVSQPSRNERDGAIFAGTMGLIRRSALEQAGGWDEWCITEDAELSLRLLRNGWSGLHVDRSFGVGVMPLTFEALKGQRFRWCFGGIQIMRRHWRLMLPGRRGQENQMSNGQRWAYLSGALQWYGDLIGLLFYVFLLVGAANVALGGGLLFRKLTGFLLAAIPMLVLLGFVRAVALLRRGTGASWRDAFGAFMIWQSTALVVARASVQGLFAREAEFLRTPKTTEDAHWWDAVRGNLGESVLALLGVVALIASLSNPSGYGSILAAALLLWPTLAYASAPYNSLSAQRAALPAHLRTRRRTEYQRSSAARHVTYAMAGLGVAGAAAAVAVVLFAPGKQPVVTPQLFGPARGHGADYHQPATTHTAPPSSSPPAGAPSTPASTTTSAPSSTPVPTTPTSSPPTSSAPTTSSSALSSSVSSTP
jgi:glycosyltransferase involved in cell wall biosynthesis